MSKEIFNSFEADEKLYIFPRAWFIKANFDEKFEVNLKFTTQTSKECLIFNLHSEAIKALEKSRKLRDQNIILKLLHLSDEDIEKVKRVTILEDTANSGYVSLYGFQTTLDIEVLINGQYEIHKLVCHSTLCKVCKVGLNIERGNDEVL